MLHRLFGRSSIAVVAVACICAASHAASAQEIGAKIGVNVASVNVDGAPGDVFTSGQRVGVVAGAFLVQRFHDWSLQAEGLVTVKGTKQGDATIRLTYLELPVLARIDLTNASGQRVHLFTGPAFGFNFDAASSDGTTSTDIGDEIEGTDTSWVIGGGVTLHGGLILDARYTVGLTNIRSDVAPDAGSVKNRAFSVMAGFTFGK